jgi:phenylpropionate dioxygenase-like ring-hydroxylating dioxygenase large terminal subunit
MESKAMFLRNSWYVVAWTHELGEKPIGIRVLDESIVIFRDGDGRPAVLEDRCAHRHFPLSLGCPVASGIQCGYHGPLFRRARRSAVILLKSAMAGSGRGWASRTLRMPI